MHKLKPSSRLIAAAFAACALVTPAAHAYSCTLSGHNGDYQVAEFHAAGISTPAFQRNDPIAPVNDQSDYLSLGGAYLVSQDMYNISMAGAEAPRAVISSGSTRVDQPLVGTWPEGIHGDSRVTLSGSQSGTSYFVAYGWGPQSGALGSGDWQASVQFDGTAPCTILSHQDAPGEIVNINQGDFEGTQVYVPGFGVGQGLTKDLYPHHHVALGQIYASLSGQINFSYKTGGDPGSGAFKCTEPIDCLYYHVLETTIGATTNPMHFTLSYAGADPLVNINYLDVAIPGF